MVDIDDKLDVDCEQLHLNFLASLIVRFLAVEFSLDNANCLTETEIGVRELFLILCDEFCLMLKSSLSKVKKCFASYCFEFAVCFSAH
jgi:hypothetical protein